MGAAGLQLLFFCGSPPGNMELRGNPSVVVRWVFQKVFDLSGDVYKGYLTRCGTNCLSDQLLK